MTEIKDQTKKAKKAIDWKKYYNDEQKQKKREYYQEKRKEIKLAKEHAKGNTELTLDDIEVSNKRGGDGRPCKLTEEQKQITKKAYEKLTRLFNKMSKMGVETDDIKHKVEKYEEELKRRHILKA